MESKLAIGDVAHIEFDVWVVGAGEQRTLHDTTHADVAKASAKYDEKRSYGPVPIVVGHGRVPKGLDEALLGATVGETKEVTIPPEKGAGERDPRLLKLYPIREFHKKDIDPAPGLEVSVEGRRGTIVAVTAGRVRVDFNNPLAGRTLQYKVTVAKRAESAEDKIRAVVEMDYGLGEEFKIFVKEGGEADVFLPGVCKTDERWFVSKFRVVADLREFAGISKVRFVEEYERPEEKKEAPAVETKPEPAADEKPAEGKPTEGKRAKRQAPPTAKGRRGKAPPKKAPRAEEELPPDGEKSPEEL